MIARIPSWRDLPGCNVCGRLAETCLYYDSAGCVGAPVPRRPTPEQAEYLGKLARAMEAVRR